MFDDRFALRPQLAVAPGNPSAGGTPRRCGPTGGDGLRKVGEAPPIGDRGPPDARKPGCRRRHRSPRPIPALPSPLPSLKPGQHTTALQFRDVLSRPLRRRASAYEQARLDVAVDPGLGEVGAGHQ